MTFNSSRTSCKPLFKQYDLLTMPSLYIFKILLFVKINEQSFTINRFEHKYPTRFKNNFQYPRHRLSLFEKSPYYMGLRLFNSLPAELKDIHDLTRFRNTLRSHLLSKVYYSIDDYLNNSSK